ncbi:SDR family oxidoreductase [Micromonospora inyonensis]|uniref:NAD(P)-dependent dehydrogenase, short-chain alcohol dehydrogenase family n=1 Tax=Micromonospora inyonensis TaxID=47866 RepID=A0A1C6S7A2_9ACTN|nr:SDR family oxidoreductase [Micromonospora inyonensis]SCL25326.1 NAD(P)-dependent dehydrogenase, short-chain alcohol dehydrogenase family [Micromonospora inyonensis]
MRLREKVVVVTGAARGIGRATALACASEGADVVLLDVAADIDGCPYPLGTPDQLAMTAKRCAEHAVTVTSHAVDVRDGAAASAAIDETLDRFGRVDVLVNNAGLAAPAGVPVHEVSEEQWRLILDVDLDGAWRMLRLTVPSMLRTGRGSVVNIASTAGLVGYRSFAAYVTAKHALVGLTKAAALDLAPHGVRVNAVCPGSVRDDPALDGRMLAEIARALGLPVTEHERTFVADQPTNRLVRAEDVARACVWLGSDESTDVTGAAIPVDGGFTAR